LAANDLPTSLSTIKAEHLERYMVWTIEEASPGSAQFHFRSLQQFFRWAVDEGLIDRSPMAKMKRPQVDEVPPPVLTDAQLATLLIACDGRDFESRRDRALIRLLIDTGCRRSEILGLRWQPNEPDNNDVDLAQRTLRARGKGGRWRFLHFGRRPP
jgi:site-specific recombinase XerD